jgi:hypothetical protein
MIDRASRRRVRLSRRDRQILQDFCVGLFGISRPRQVPFTGLMRAAPTHFCAVMRHNPRPQAPPHPASARQQERQPTCAACPNLAATVVSLSIAPCQFRPDSCGVIGFVSQFFFIDIGRPQLDEHSRHSSCADDGAVGAQRSLPRVKAHGWIPSHLAVCCMTMRILRAKESWLTGATGQERQPVPELESLASPRNSINIAARRWRKSRHLFLVP